MAHRKYKPRNWSFEYNFDRDGGANGFLALDNDIPIGWTFLSGNIHVITAVTSGGGAATVRLGTATVNFANPNTENTLTANGVIRITLDGAAPAFARNTIQQPLGITLGNGPLLSGRFVCFGQYVIITTG